MVARKASQAVLLEVKKAIDIIHFLEFERRNRLPLIFFSYVLVFVTPGTENENEQKMVEWWLTAIKSKKDVCTKLKVFSTLNHILSPSFGFGTR